MAWSVRLSNKANKQSMKMPKAVKAALLALMDEIALLGPIRGNWPNYSKLADGGHHCHLKKRKTDVRCRMGGRKAGYHRGDCLCWYT